MKEMKYRAWDGEQFLYLDLNNVEPDINIEWLLMFFRLPKQQYIGHNDVNKKELYEGDIIKKHFEYDDLGIIGDIRQMSYDLSKSEYVGNEFENPELLEQL